jgi:mannose-6-phosphate isomerase
MTVYPLLLQPTLHTRVWGGRRLHEIFNKALPTAEPYGESWEAHNDCVVLNGPFAGRTVADVIDEFGYDVVGKRNNPNDGLPLLAKFLDASDWLSVQVHPNDEYAKDLESDPRGKTEAWIVLDATNGRAPLVLGVKQGLSKLALQEAIEKNQLEDLLNFVDVSVGDVVFLDAGMIHALGPGLLIYEIQQSSDTTYRLYDWGRMGLDGQPRQLHIDKGLHVSNLQATPNVQSINMQHEAGRKMIRSSFFHTNLINVHPNSDNDSTRIAGRGSKSPRHRAFEILTCISGHATVEVLLPDQTLMRVPMQTGQTVLIPAITDEYGLFGDGKVLCSYQPQI